MIRFILILAIAALGQKQNPNMGLEINVDAGMLKDVPSIGNRSCVTLNVTRPLDTNSIDSLGYSRGVKNNGHWSVASQPAYKIFDIKADDYFFTDRTLSEEHSIFTWQVFCATQSKLDYFQSRFKDTSFTNAGGYLMLYGLSQEQKLIMASDGYINGRVTGGNVHIVEAQCSSCSQR